MKLNPREARIRRHLRARRKVRGSPLQPRLCVFRSLNHIYAQVIDDTIGHTLVAASTLDAEIKTQLNGKPKTDDARLVGMLLGQRALGQGIQKVVFDRDGNAYHGRVKALAEGAREAGVQF